MSAEPNSLDLFIEQLMTCKPLRESEVKFLCEKVLFIKTGQRNFTKGK
jgi:hypothetical protein